MERWDLFMAHSKNYYYTVTELGLTRKGLDFGDFASDWIIIIITELIQS